MPLRRMFRNTRTRYALIEQVGYVSLIMVRPALEYCKHMLYALNNTHERIANPVSGLNKDGLDLFIVYGLV